MAIRSRLRRGSALALPGIVVTAAIVASAMMAVAPQAGATGSSTQQGTTELVSVATGGQQGNDLSGRFAGPAISGDGRVVAFDSVATTLANDTNNMDDVFVRDRDAQTTELVSVSAVGGAGNSSSGRPALDRTGDLVAFDSSASNLVGRDTNQAMDVFVRDLVAGTTTRVSVASDGTQADAASNSPSMSDDGRYVSFVSVASNLVAGDTNGAEDIFVRDLVAGTTERVSVTSAGGQAGSSSTSASIGADGRWVAFSSFASDLVANDTNGQFDVFVHDRQTGLTELVSLSSDEAQANALSATPRVSADGNLVTYWSDATNLVPGDTNDVRDVFVRDRAAGTTERVSVSSTEQQADGTSEEPGVRGFLASGPDITPDGRFVSFFSSATNLVAGDTNTCPLFFAEPGTCPDVFVRDRLAGTTSRVDVAADGTQANDRSADPAISDDGASVAFFSAAANLVAGDTNVCPLFSSFPGNCPDIFVHDGLPVVTAQADLAVTVTDSSDPVVVGARLHDIVKVTNAGPDAATAATVIVDLPAGARFLSASTTAGACVSTGHQLACTLGDLAAGGAVSVRVDVRPFRPGALRTTATVSTSSLDPVATNDTDTERTTAVAP